MPPTSAAYFRTTWDAKCFEKPSQSPSSWTEGGKLPDEKPHATNFAAKYCKILQKRVWRVIPPRSVVSAMTLGKLMKIQSGKFRRLWELRGNFEGFGSVPRHSLATGGESISPLATPKEEICVLQQEQMIREHMINVVADPQAYVTRFRRSQLFDIFCRPLTDDHHSITPTDPQNYRKAASPIACSIAEDLQSQRRCVSLIRAFRAEGRFPEEAATGGGGE